MLSLDLKEAVPLTGGGNNRVFRLRLPDGTDAVLKHYFTHPDDLRPRLKHEFSFLTYAWSIGIRNIPQPLDCNEEQNIGLYSFIEGTRASATPESIDAAIDFLIALNQQKPSLPYASEACLEPSHHIEAVEKRLEKLLAIEELRTFVTGEVIPAWNKIKPSQAALQSHSLWVSPSDFGFHNALQSDQTYFIDFEYAGWDDPVKTACDFFSQPKVPVPLNYFDAFLQKTAHLADPDYAARARLLLPVYRIKWCCMMLSGFFGVGKERRNFAHAESQQLEKAKNYLKESLCI